MTNKFIVLSVGYHGRVDSLVIPPRCYRDLGEIANLSSSQNSQSLKPCDYYQIYTIIEGTRVSPFGLVRAFPTFDERQ